MTDTASTKQLSSIRRVVRVAWTKKGTVFFLLALAVIFQGTSLIVPFISKTLINSLTQYIASGGKGALPWNVLIYSALGILIATVVSSAFQSSYNYHLFKFVTKTEDQLRHMAFEKYLRLHTLFHHNA